MQVYGELENPSWSVTMHSNGILTLDAGCVHPFIGYIHKKTTTLIDHI